ncbi:hypothetical protein D3C81_1631600 [compost metagenome]
MIEIGFADDNRTGIQQALHDGGVLFGDVGEFRAGGRGAYTGDVDIVLGCKRYAVQRQRRQIGICQAACFQCLQLCCEIRLIDQRDPCGVILGQAIQQCCQ